VPAGRVSPGWRKSVAVMICRPCSRVSSSRSDAVGESAVVNVEGETQVIIISSGDNRDK
jgi:hypothetical protein